MFSAEKKQDRSTYVAALERALYDFFVSMGDVEDENLGNGGSYRGYHYEPLEVPLGVVARHVGFRLQGGQGYERLRQLHDEGIYRWRRNGPGKPSFLSLLIWDRQLYFEATKNSRIQNYILRREAAAKLPELRSEFIDNINGSGQDDVQRYAYLAKKFTDGGRSADVTNYWNAYKKQRKNR